MTASDPTLRFSTQLPLNPTPPTYEAVTSPRKVSFVKDKKKPKKERDLFINSNCYSLSSSERALNEDSFVLDQFLNIYNTRPLVLMIIEGYRWSKVLRKCITCSNAYDQNDFTLTLDLSPYLPEHSPIQTTETFLSDYDSKSTASVPSSKIEPKFGSLEEALHYFTQKDRFMQKISVKKEAQIPTQRLASLVTQLIRGEGYKHNIKITFRTYLKEIKVFSHRVDSRVARNHFLKTLACCTGLWMPILPAHRYYHNKNTIQLYANYDMCLSPEYWLINHQIQITDAVQDYLKSTIRS